MNETLKRYLQRLVLISLVCLTTAGPATVRPTLIFYTRITLEKPQLSAAAVITTPTDLPDQSVTYVDMSVCHPGPNKTYMFSSSLSKSSQQMQYINTYMTAKDGLYYDADNHIGVALGSYFGDIGDRFIFELDNGVVLKVVKVEAKADQHTSADNCYQKWDGSVVEFVVNKDTHNFWVGENGYLLNGNFNNIEQFNGNIIKISKEVKNGDN